MISEDDLKKVRDLIYKETGMLFGESKNYYLKSRIEQRLKELEIDNHHEYLEQLMTSTSKAEVQDFVERITINETYFFRDFPQLQGFAEKVLPHYINERNCTSNKIRIWSAACSTGEEAYTLSIILQEMLEKGWKSEIKATDIDREVLNKAKRGLYSTRSMKDTPTPYKEKYFTRDGDKFKVNKAYFKDVTFDQLNFMDRFGMLRMRDFDFIFCRNVLIYFTDDSRKKVVNRLYDALKPGGYLFLGHSESIGRITGAFNLKNIEGFLCYQKPQG